MIRFFLIIFASTFLIYNTAQAEHTPSDAKLNTLYCSLNKYSIADLFAFYSLYPETSQGKQSLADAWNLLYAHQSKKPSLKAPFALPKMDLNAIIALVNKQPFENIAPLTEEELQVIENIADQLGNRKLKGFYTWNKESLVDLPTEEIDLARALLLYQFSKEKDKEQKVRQYEASLDLMSLQILATLPKEATSEEKIEAINHFIFYEKQFRFPPHSLWAKDIDVYTFLPSVLDNRLGVCLGVSILYLSIAQRLELSLEIITPPGHIYLSYQTPEKTINIETTARGVSMPSKAYLGINTRKLQKQTMKEVIGLAFINQASVAWQKGEHEITVDLYEKALPFLPNSTQLKMLLGYNYLFCNRMKEGKKLLKEIENVTFDYAVYKETLPEDYLKGYVNVEGIEITFQHVDENRASILDKQEKLKEILKKYPKFRDGHLQLAITFLQLGQEKEGLKQLAAYHELDPNNPTVEYYIAALSMNRFLYKEAWNYLKAAQALVKARNHHPDCLRSLYHQLRRLSPDPDEKVTWEKEIVAHLK